MQQAQITVYSTNYCPYCRSAKSLLTSKGLLFKEINVEGDEEKRAWLVKTTGQRTVPQIFINEKSIGGFQELDALEQSGQLDKLLGVA